MEPNIVNRSSHFLPWFQVHRPCIVAVRDTNSIIKNPQLLKKQQHDSIDSYRFHGEQLILRKTNTEM